MPRSPKLIALVAVLAAAACTQAPGPVDAGAGFDALDTDADGLIEQAEFAQSFARFDLNGDGVIDAQENADIVYEADGDRDGRVTLDEFTTIDLARLEADADFDGRISLKELEDYERASRLEPASSLVSSGETYARKPPEVRWVRFRF